MTPKFIKFERLGVGHEGESVKLEIEGQIYYMPYTIGILLANNIAKHAHQAKENSQEFQKIKEEFLNG